MPIINVKTRYMIPLEPEAFYHIYNRANGSEKVFLSDDNYSYFLRQYRAYIEPIAHTYCYCLMPNHFHLLVSIKGEGELVKALPKSNKKPLEILLSNQFGNLFNSYAKAFNKQHNRMGSLFMKNFKRKKISNNKYRLTLVNYIHHNPVEAGLCIKPENWKYSSYNDLISENETMLKRSEVLDWFEGRDNFIYCHKQLQEMSEVE